MSNLTHQFVELIPEKLADGVVFVSTTYCIASHLCCCGCGREVVTPIAPKEWSVTFDGESVTLHPSIGNWRFPCRSHYWIRKNHVEWVPDWENDDELTAVDSPEPPPTPPRKSLWRRLLGGTSGLARKLLWG